jgi:hypothetical protein
MNELPAVGWLLVLAVDCGARGPALEVTRPPPLARAQAPSAVASSAPAVPTPSASPLAPFEVHLVRELEAKVSSIALGDGSRIALLGDTPYAGDARGLRALPLPNALKAKPDEHDDLRVFFGRDNQPRVMGGRLSPTGEASVYWRYTNSGWKDGRDEIGQLGGTTRGKLWGVLGAADPELVCRVSSLCIIKRASGWITAPAGSTPRRVELLGGLLWGLDESGLANIDAHGWSVVIPAPNWSEPRAFWATNGEAWVATERTLFHFHEGVWSDMPPPIAAPSAFWGARADSIWLVGKGGAAHFDGQAWRATSIAGPLTAVNGRSDTELWFGGDAGLFRVRP